LENNNNAHFSSNGEERFLARTMFGKFSGAVVLFDIGGNIGGYSEILVAECRRRSLEFDLLHVFEPTTSCFTILRSKFSGQPDVHLNNAGVSNAAGAAGDISTMLNNSGFASLYQRNLSSLNVEMKKKESI
jgi:FkbM family methyltransferase